MYQNTNIIISIDGNEDEGFSIRNDNILNKGITNYRTTKEAAKNTAKEVAQEYGYDTKEYGYIKIESNLDSDKDSYIYSVTFCKEYNGIKNPYESIHISFIPEIMKYMVLHLLIKNLKIILLKLQKRKQRKLF